MTQTSTPESIAWISNTLTTYETWGGERAFVRHTIDTIDPGVPGFSAPRRDRRIIEAVFVDDSEAAFAEFILTCAPHDASLADELEARGIPFRGPGGATAPVVQLPLDRKVITVVADDEAA